MTTSGNRKRIDWQAERDRIDLAAVATGLLGQAPGRIGERGRKLWWHCPFHHDPNPSFMVEPGKPRWRCWGCGERGDAATLVMRLENLSFREALARLTGGPARSGTTRTRPSPIPRPEPKPPEAPTGPKGLPEGDALALVVEAEARLWSSEGVDALAYLTDRRCLTLATIRAARLGWTPGVRVPMKDGGSFSARGIVIPWFDGDRLTMIKLRQPEGDRPKYAEAFRNRPSLYPDRRIIRPGRPLVIVEGDFDALLLGQELADRAALPASQGQAEGKLLLGQAEVDLAAVVTLGGSGSTKPEPVILESMLAAAPWFIATDADDAGDKAADRWGATRAQRVRPPKPFNDWTEARQGRVNLRRWWADRIGGDEAPPLFSWDDLAEWRWGLVDDSVPGIIIDETDPAQPIGKPRASRTQIPASSSTSPIRPDWD